MILCFWKKSTSACILDIRLSLVGLVSSTYSISAYRLLDDCDWLVCLLFCVSMALSISRKSRSFMILPTFVWTSVDSYVCNTFLSCLDPFMSYFLKIESDGIVNKFSITMIFRDGSPTENLKSNRPKIFPMSDSLCLLKCSPYSNRMLMNTEYSSLVMVLTMSLLSWLNMNISPDAPPPLSPAFWICASFRKMFKLAEKSSFVGCVSMIFENICPPYIVSSESVREQFVLNFSDSADALMSNFASS